MTTLHLLARSQLNLTCMHLSRGPQHIPVHLVHQAPVPKTLLRVITENRCHLHAAMAQHLWCFCHGGKGFAWD